MKYKTLFIPFFFSSPAFENNICNGKCKSVRVALPLGTLLYCINVQVSFVDSLYGIILCIIFFVEIS